MPLDRVMVPMVRGGHGGTMLRTSSWPRPDAHAAALDERLSRSLRPIAFVLGVMYVTSVIHRASDPLLLATTAPTAIVPALLFLVLGVLLTLRPMPPALAHPVTLLCLGFMTVETLGRGEPAAGVNLHWALIGLGAVVLRPRWATGSAAAIIVPWTLVAALGLNGWSLAHGGFALDMTTATALGAVIFVARRRDVIGALDAQDALLESRSVYRRVLSVLQDAVIRLDGAGRIVRMNPRAEQILGVQEHDGKRLTAASVPWSYLAQDGTPMAPDDAPSLAVLRTGRPVSSELVGIRRADGVVTWVTENAAPGKLGADGRPEEIVISLTDVTPLRNALDSVSRSEARVREVVDSAGDAILVLDTHGRVTFANPAVARLTGYPADAIVGMRAVDALDPRDRARVQAAVSGLGGGETEVETRVVRADGSHLWLEVRAHRLPDGTLEVIGRDIGARRALEAERDRLAIAVEQSSDAVALMDLDGRIVYGNAAFEHLYGVTRADVAGRLSVLWDPCVSPASAIDERREALRRTGRWSGDVEHRHANGSSLLAATRIVSVRDPDGALAGYLGLVTDVSRERALEATLARAARMEAIGQLAGGVAHDFNNLLTAVLGHAELAAVEADGLPQVRAELAEIIRAGERAQALTRQLLAFGRRSLLRPRAVDVASVTTGLEPMLRRLIGEDVALVVDTGVTPGPVEVDPSLLEHAIVNLVVNARDAMPEGGLIRIETGATRPGDEVPDGTWAVIRVADTGPGIPAEVREHMFEPFFSTKPEGRGTGLGLAMVHGFVDQSGGRVQVRTRPDAGTTLTILLPVMEACRATAVPAEPRPARTARPVARKGTVLVVEDEAVLRAIAERVLQNAGYTVLIAESAESAVRVASAYPEPIDLLFTDIVMPGVHGVALAKSLRATRPGIRVLITSGYTEDDVIRRGVDMGETPFLPKPYTPSGLVAAAEEALT